MKKIIIISIVVCLMVVLFFVNAANADLSLLGQGISTHGTYNLIYDTDLDITWYDYTNSGDRWQNQMNWASGLSVTFGINTYTDWRLPITFDENCEGFNCTNSEMGHLYYTELGNPALGPLTNTGDFQNLQPLNYWLGTDYASIPSQAWVFDFFNGLQHHLTKSNFDFYGVAVRPGLAVVPEPISSILFVTGGGVLIGRLFIRRKRS